MTWTKNHYFLWDVRHSYLMIFFVLIICLSLRPVCVRGGPNFENTFTGRKPQNLKEVECFLFNTHLGNSLNFTTVCHCQVMGGIPLPSRGMLGKNRSTQSKTTVRSKRVGPLGSRWGPFTWFPECYLFICFCFH